MQLLKNPYSINEDAADLEIPTATLQIYDFIAEYLKRPIDTHVNRASSANMCPKRRWYQRNGYEGKPLTPRKNVNFLLGDLAEKCMNYFVKQGCVGPGKLYSEVIFGEAIGKFTFQGKEIEIYKQEDLEATIGEIRVTAHVDGWGKRNLDGQWELIEFKSASNYGFSDFKRSGAGDYLRQATVNLQTTKAKELGAKQVRFFFLRKETGHLWSSLHDFDPKIATEVEEGYRIAMQVEEPKAPFGPIAEMTGRKPNKKPTGRKTLGFPCTYCAFVEHCQPKFEMEWETDYQSGNQKPTYVIKGGE